MISLYMLCLALFIVGLYCVVRKRNLIKIIIGIGIMGYAVNLFFVLIGYNEGGRSPIFAADQEITRMVDPAAQAVVSTVIVIGLSLTLVLIAIAIKVYEKYGTFDITKINELKG
jgi:multicomponent Na+:H+ antiporter subunit C